ncbi:Transcriptional regulator, GntR family [Frankia canadensis]|uniref:Transcriptional regulator, GntR family n=1 Tax=Frankia canadensis TaxID=1836972 RepID=A0A2I2KLQ4_9ACTN|nr:Transcriptional regulator, GntR family [Frankia canadensis]SOU53866.1 Transcriptional regulator, GntR family [Frankia canadensis]
MYRKRIQGWFDNVDRAGIVRADDHGAATPGTDAAGPPNRTRAAWVARQIEADIIARGWPVGEALGSEAQLIERFGVGRPVLREAFRILESRWVAKPRPGPGGGLVVTAPRRSSVRDVARLFLDYVGFADDDLYSVWEILEVAAVAQLAMRIDDEGIAALRAAVRVEEDVADLREQIVTVHTEIGRLVGNPFIELFLYIVSDLSRVHGVDPTDEQRRWLHTRHVELVEAIVAGDVLGAQRLTRRLLSALARSRSLNVVRPPDPGRRQQD